MPEREEGEWLERVRGEYRSSGPASDASRERLLHRLASEPAPARASASPFRWLGQQSLSVQGGIACAALLLAAASGIGAFRGLDLAASARRAALAPASGPLAAVPEASTVTFALRAPQVSSVALVGDFNAWDPRATPMRRQGQGDLWTAQVELADGLHSYAYVIDGEQWQPDPGAPLSPETPFGLRSSVIVVGEKEAL